MSAARLAVLTALVMLAFAGNSLLCRLALKGTAIDPASFTAVRIVCGAAVLVAIAQWRRAPAHRAGTWTAAFVLFAYAATFSYAYVSLTAGTGALLLFAAVQATMIGWGVWRGERLGLVQVGGLVLAAGGLVGLVLPGLSAPPLGASLLMIASGIAWGAYSLLGKGKGDPTQVTAGNFLRGVVPAAALALLTLASATWDPRGVAYATASGALTSGLGYVLWYSVLPRLRATNAAIVQLSVPVIAAFGGVLFLSEGLSLRLALASVAVLGGIALVIAAPRPARPA
ncbi:DMT family transporter [Ramlibacter algicola]|uniref:DMT family transporter n=1 Tax=Ramlibacter algicola TaxID=2795217 RepID=A0A934URP7_9BURK|nr:DMT family transporter [Ramlibacter algicola]MBK0393969.1 DMT family transporter [Ramlibacter algicola]